MLKRTFRPSWACVRSSPGADEITFRLPNRTITITLAGETKSDFDGKTLETLKAELDAIGNLEDTFCACGCGAVLVFHDCFRVNPEPILSPMEIATGLVNSEIAAIRAGLQIDAIKGYRDRYLKENGHTIGLKDAKDKCDAARLTLHNAGEKIITPGGVWKP